MPGKIIAVLIIIFSLFTIVHSENIMTAKFTHFALGVKTDIKLFNEYKIGLTASSPYLLDDWITLRGEYDIGVLRGDLKSTIGTNDIWMSYSVIKAGIAALANKNTDTVRPYIEFGYMGVIPNKLFTDDIYAWGIYGLLGYELIFDPTIPWSFYFEFCANALLSGGISEKITDAQTYAQNIWLTFGARYYF
jgi:hypothetical protein